METDDIKKEIESFMHDLESVAGKKETKVKAKKKPGKAKEYCDEAKAEAEAPKEASSLEDKTKPPKPPLQQIKHKVLNAMADMVFSTEDTEKVAEKLIENNFFLLGNKQMLKPWLKGLIEKHGQFKCLACGSQFLGIKALQDHACAGQQPVEEAEAKQAVPPSSPPTEGWSVKLEDTPTGEEIAEYIKVMPYTTYTQVEEALKVKYPKLPLDGYVKMMSAPAGKKVAQVSELIALYKKYKCNMCGKIIQSLYEWAKHEAACKKYSTIQAAVESCDAPTGDWVFEVHEDKEDKHKDFLNELEKFYTLFAESTDGEIPENPIFISNDGVGGYKAHVAEVGQLYKILDYDGGKVVLVTEDKSLVIPQFTKPQAKKTPVSGGLGELTVNVKIGLDETATKLALELLSQYYPNVGVQAPPVL